MKVKARSALVTLWANRLVMLLLGMLLFLMPVCVDWYSRHRLIPRSGLTAILVGFYCCAPFIAAALVMIEQLLRNILSAQVFIRKNVLLIRRVRWCCLAISVMCIPAACFYVPLIFVTVIMAFLWLVVSVVADVMASAVTLREENDLTI